MVATDGTDGTDGTNTEARVGLSNTNNGTTANIATLSGTSIMCCPPINGLRWINSTMAFNGIPINAGIWSGFSVTAYGPNWGVYLKRTYAAYWQNDIPDMATDLAALPDGAIVFVCTADATCDSIGSNIADATNAMASINASSFVENYPNYYPLRFAYCGIMLKGGAPLIETFSYGYPSMTQLQLAVNINAQTKLTLAPTSRTPTMVPSVVTTILPSLAPSIATAISSLQSTTVPEWTIAIAVISVVVFIMSILFAFRKSIVALCRLNYARDAYNSAVHVTNHTLPRALNDESSPELDAILVPSYEWSRIEVEPSVAFHQRVLGHGSHAIVIRAKLLGENGSRDIPVAIKVATEIGALGRQRPFELERKRLLYEAKIVTKAERLINSDDHIIRVLGTVNGTLDNPALAMALGVAANQLAFGIVMRYESGGTLHDVLHPGPTIGNPLNLAAKLNILSQIALGLADLHAVGITHGDLKPSNILLSNPVADHKFDASRVRIRLSDFGMSIYNGPLSAPTAIGQSMLQRTLNRHGTPIYSAPEVLGSGEIGDATSESVRSSRSTDMYSFGIIIHEVLSCTVPFQSIPNELALAIQVHRGQRPPLNLIPDDVPPGVIDMMKACWNGQRTLRKSAPECFEILQHLALQFEQDSFDIFFSHVWNDKPFLSHVYYLLSRKGYKVWYDKNQMGYNLESSMIAGIRKSKVLVACINKTYQGRQNCMFELTTAKGLNKPIIVLVVDPDPDIQTWGNNHISELCQLEKRFFIDLSKHAKLKWAENASLCHWISSCLCWDSQADDLEPADLSTGMATAISTAAAEPELNFPNLYGLPAAADGFTATSSSQEQLSTSIPDSDIHECYDRRKSQMIVSLAKDLQPLLRLLTEIDCMPTLAKNEEAAILSMVV